MCILGVYVVLDGFRWGGRGVNVPLMFTKGCVSG